MDVIIGGAGFIGSNLCEQLLAKSRTVSVIDNFSLGRMKNLSGLALHDIVECDASDAKLLSAVLVRMQKQSIQPLKIWHLAANSDIPSGIDDPQIDLKDTLATTIAILQSMKTLGLKAINFASSSAIYGDLGEVQIQENAGGLEPVSQYGACKLASEALISAAREAFLEDVSIFRFPNVVGAPATHGVIFDFVKKLMADNKALSVLGNGTQQKSYLHVSELVQAMIHVDNLEADSRSKIYNIGPNDDMVSVKTIAEIVVAKFGCNAEIKFGSSSKGWLGDIPRFRYDTSKLNKTGWRASMSSRDAVTKAALEIINQLSANR